MTLVAGIVLPDGGVWLGGDRYAGEFAYTQIAGPKVFELSVDERTDQTFAIGFAGSPRVAQVILAVTPPPRDSHSHSLHWWLTEYCDAIRERAEAMGVLVDNGKGNGAELAGETEVLLAIEGRLVRIGCDLAWEEPARGQESIGAGAWMFDGAYEVLLEHHEPITAARLAWPIVKRRQHVGDLADEVIVPAVRREAEA